MAQWYINVLYAFEIIFTVIYTFEVVVKLQGMGWRRYFRTGMNRLDFVIVFIAHAGNILTYFGQGMDASSSQSLRIVKVLARLARLMRVARVGKLISRVKSIRTVLKVAFGSLDAIGSLSFLFVFVCFVAAMMGTFIFWPCHGINADGSQRRTELNGMNLGSLRDSFFSVFQLSTGDDWSGLMFEYMECFGGGAAVYFVVVVFVTRYLLLNLYISVFLENFQLNDEQKRQRQVEEYAKSEIARMEHTKEGAALATIAIANTLSRTTPLGRLHLDEIIHTVQDGLQEGGVGSAGGGTTEQRPAAIGGSADSEMEKLSGRAQSADEAYQGYEKAMAAELLKAAEDPSANKHTFDNPLLPALLTLSNDEDSPNEDGQQAQERNVALGIFPENSPIRAFFKKLVESDVFDKVIIVCIALSGMHIALEGPGAPH
eukprot:COSAG03_NODE_688_length_6294_cov_4.784988_2_plen_429_part_00